MTVLEFAEKLAGVILTGETGKERVVEGLYCCDLLSRVMSRSNTGDAWITVHTHLNTVAVASFSDLSCIVLPEGIRAEEATVNRAVLEGVPIVSTDLDAYRICCIACECEI